MIECAVNNISKSFGAEKIFDSISFEVKSKDRIGLVGPNGVGKTTILKILMGIESCDGDVSFRKGVQPGYLEQMPEYGPDYTAENVIRTAFDDLFSMQQQMHDLEEQMAHSDMLDNVMNQYHQLQVQFEMAGGYDMQEKTSRVIQGLKITPTQLRTRFDHLSGGEKTKIMLAKILLESPPLLLLDEPSNHLDLDTMEWLESYLSRYDGAVVIVSHDRYFLDHAVNKIIEITPHGALVYHGNYSYFVEQKHTQYELDVKAYNQNQKDIKKIKETILRFRIWADSRSSEKMYKLAKQFERKLENMEKLDKPHLHQPKMRLRSKATDRTGREVIVIDQLSKTFGHQSLFKGIDLNVFYQDATVILGHNGCGKSTLLRILMKEIQPDQGTIKYGAKLKIGYLPQKVVFSDEDKTILEYFQYKYNLPNSIARNELAKALFVGDDVFKTIRILSGGEKSRLRLCTLFYEQVNFLVLDEPTNHLDIESREHMESMLEKFDGTLLFVSHDRYFIAKLAQKVAAFENGQLVTYDGNYAYYRQQLEKKAALLIPQETPSKRSKQARKHPANDRKRSKDQLMRDTQRLELEIQQLERQSKQLNHEMIRHGNDAETLRRLWDEKSALDTTLQDTMEQWEDASEQLESAL